MLRITFLPISDLSWELSWDWLPRLKLLGIPGGQGTLFDRLPASHSLRHLHLYLDSGPDRPSGNGHIFFFAFVKVFFFASVKEILEWYPTVTRISLSSLNPHEGMGPRLQGFNEENANDIGFTFTQCNKDARGREDFQILERLPYQPPPPAHTKKQVIQSTLKAPKSSPPTHSMGTQQSTPRADKQTYAPARQKPRAPNQTHPSIQYVPQARKTPKPDGRDSVISSCVGVMFERYISIFTWALQPR